jgi:ATP-dependent RNA helicase UAP56/SUB2
MMFSATMSQKTKDTCRMYMKNPKEIFIDSEKNLTLHGLKQFYVRLEEDQKIKKLIQLLDDLDFNQVIIFVKTQEYAKKLNDIIRDTGFPSAACYSSMPTEERLKVYNEFKNYKYRILVSTDLFGRGIDIEKINVVINYNMPNESDQYLHRVGRAGRFGTKGLSISFISTADDQKVLDDVQDRFEVKVEDLPTTIEKSWYMNN